MRNQLIAALLCASASVATLAHADSPGDALFNQGGGAEVVIGAGAVTMPATRFACAGCHGRDGMGRREGGTIFPPVEWQSLTAPDRAAPYDAETFARAVRGGVDASERTLSSVMPRYQMDDEVMASLIAYLKTLNTAARTGITAHEFRFAATGDMSFDAGFRAYADKINAEGGIFGRQIKMGGEGAMIDIDPLAAQFSERLDAMCVDALLRTIRSDGARELQIVGERAGGVSYQAQTVGLKIVEQADAVLILSGNELPTLTGKEIYGCPDVLGSAVQDLVSHNKRVTLGVADRTALGWARANRLDGHAIDGMVFAKLLTQALMNAGRLATMPKVEEELARLRIDHELVRLSK